jgi:hypothetical protein
MMDQNYVKNTLLLAQWTRSNFFFKSEPANGLPSKEVKLQDHTIFNRCFSRSVLNHVRYYPSHGFYLYNQSGA